jgi:hypothetical protein
MLRLMLLSFPCALHPVNRYAHKHALADVNVEEPQKQADAAEPAVPGEEKRCDLLERNGYLNQQCMPART